MAASAGPPPPAAGGPGGSTRAAPPLPMPSPTSTDDTALAALAATVAGALFGAGIGLTGLAAAPNAPPAAAAAAAGSGSGLGQPAGSPGFGSRQASSALPAVAVVVRLEGLVAGGLGAALPGILPAAINRVIQDTWAAYRRSMEACVATSVLSMQRVMTDCTIFVTKLVRLLQLLCECRTPIDSLAMCTADAWIKSKPANVQSLTRTIRHIIAECMVAYALTAVRVAHMTCNAWMQKLPAAPNTASLLRQVAGIMDFVCTFRPDELAHMDSMCRWTADVCLGEAQQVAVASQLRAGTISHAIAGKVLLGAVDQLTHCLEVVMDEVVVRSACDSMHVESEHVWKFFVAWQQHLVVAVPIMHALGLRLCACTAWAQSQHSEALGLAHLAVQILESSLHGEPTLQLQHLASARRHLEYYTSVNAHSMFLVMPTNVAAPKSIWLRTSIPIPFVPDQVDAWLETARAASTADDAAHESAAPLPSAPVAPSLPSPTEPPPTISIPPPQAVPPPPPAAPSGEPPEVGAWLPQVTKLTSTAATLSWSAPPISSVALYHLQWRPAASAVWIWCSEPVTTTVATKDMLSPGSPYQFRVAAIREGRSEILAYSHATDVIMTAADVPPPPSLVWCTLSADGRAVVHWKPAPADHGAPVIGCTVELRRQDVKEWSCVNSEGHVEPVVSAEMLPVLQHADEQTGSNRSIFIYDLPVAVYRVRVRSCNRFGLSPPTHYRWVMPGATDSRVDLVHHDSIQVEVKTPEDSPSVPDVADDVLWDRPRKSLGAGGFGSVYRSAIGGFHGMTVAVKEVTAASADAVQFDSLRREVELLRDLKHPGLITVYAASICPTRITLIMEYMDGGNLHSAIHGTATKPGNTWTLVHKLQIAVQMAEAMNYLHSRPVPVIHRDLKPQNVLLSADGLTAKLCDFGLARARKASVLMTRVAGTFEYIAPESFNSESAVTEKVDIYAFGIMLNELINGVRPWPDLAAYQITYQVAIKMARPQVAIGVPVQLIKLICECWRQDASARPSAAAVTAALCAIIEELQTDGT